MMVLKGNLKTIPISFCTTCMGRLEFVKQTLIPNMECMIENDCLCEFVLLDYNSKDGLEEWAKENLQKYIDMGLLNYYKTFEPEYWHASHARNVSFRLGHGDILCNVDADTFLDVNFYTDTMNKLYNNKKVFVRKRGMDKGGRLAIHKENFYDIGGYDERFKYGWGHEDNDLHYRLERNGLKRLKSLDFKVLKHPAELRCENGIEKDFKESRNKHKTLLDENEINQITSVNSCGFGKSILFKNFNFTLCFQLD